MRRLAGDALVLAAAYLAAFALRFDFEEPRWGWARVALGLLPTLLIGLAALWASGCARLKAATISLRAVPRFGVAAALLAALLLLLRILFPADEAITLRPPASVALMLSVLALLGWLALRYVKRLQLRPIEVADLLGRAEAEVGTPAVRHAFRGKRVLITGAGGSIGSELARQVLDAQPESLILLDLSEAALYRVLEELHGPVRGVVGNCAEREAMGQLLRQTRPEVILHAAAYKHVPLMEENPGAALKNNALGTRILAEEALAAGVAKFVLISTDKAIAPVSAMGISKRLAEVLMQDLAGGATRFCAVRFGNVLDSSGSVVPKFRRQIAAGGPVTVTDRRMKRYFMTIPEACGLVLQAAVLAEGGEIFVLDMGEPLSILHLAETMIGLAGLRPGRDIPIVFTGIRPGEKLTEDLGEVTRDATKTVHERILIGRIAQWPHAAVQALQARLATLLSNGLEPTLQDLQTLLTAEENEVQ